MARLFEVRRAREYGPHRGPGEPVRPLRPRRYLVQSRCPTFREPALPAGSPPSPPGLSDEHTGKKDVCSWYSFPSSLKELDAISRPDEDASATRERVRRSTRDTSRRRLRAAQMRQST